MNLRNIPSYNVGLDIGTGSVGWAVTDENGNLCHFKIVQHGEVGIFQVQIQRLRHVLKRTAPSL